MIRRGCDRVGIMEGKINPDKLDAKSIKVLRSLYPEEKNYIASPAVNKPYKV